MIGKEVEEACSGGKKGLLIQFVDVWSFVPVFLKCPSETFAVHPLGMYTPLEMYNIEWWWRSNFFESQETICMPCQARTILTSKSSKTFRLQKVLISSKAYPNIGCEESCCTLSGLSMLSLFPDGKIINWKLCSDQIPRYNLARFVGVWPTSSPQLELGS
jgi:hypothetical protein